MAFDDHGVGTDRYTMLRIDSAEDKTEEITEQKTLGFERTGFVRRHLNEQV